MYMRIYGYVHTDIYMYSHTHSTMYIMCLHAHMLNSPTLQAARQPNGPSLLIKSVEDQCAPPLRIPLVHQTLMFLDSLCLYSIVNMERIPSPVKLLGDGKAYKDSKLPTQNTTRMRSPWLLKGIEFRSLAGSPYRDFKCYWLTKRWFPRNPPQKRLLFKSWESLWQLRID